MATQSREKILRVGIIQNGRIIEERLLRTREAVTIGQRLSNTFVIASNEFPNSFTLFDAKGSSGYTLQFTDRMTGRMSLGDSVYDLKALRDSGKATKGGSHWTVQLDAKSRGKVVVGDVTVLFQFVAPPPLKVLPQLPANMRGGLLLFFGSVIGLNGVFLATMLMSAFSQIGTVLWLVYMVPPPPRTSDLTMLDDRFVQILTEEPDTPDPEPIELDDGELTEDEEGEPVEVADAEPVDAPPSETEPSEGPPPDEQPTRTEATIREQARQTVVQQSALGAVFASDNGVGPALTAVTSTSSLRAQDVIDNQAAGTGAGSGAIVSNSGLGTNQAASGNVGRVEVGGGGGSTVAAQAEVASNTPAQTVEIVPRVTGSREQTAGTGSIGASNLSSVLRRAERRITRCYQRGLERDPSLAGRVEAQFNIVSGGTVADARLRTNQLGDSVGNCILGEIRRLRFDEPEGGSVAVRKSWIFESGG